MKLHLLDATSRAFPHGMPAEVRARVAGIIERADLRPRQVVRRVAVSAADQGRMRRLADLTLDIKLDELRVARRLADSPTVRGRR